MKKKRWNWLIVAGLFFFSSATAFADWTFGVGTGPGAISVEGDIGVHTASAGPVKADIDISADDFSDLIDKAFGLNTFAKNGPWTFQLSFSSLELDDNTGSGATRLDIDFDITQIEGIAEYQVYKTDRFDISLFGGLRYIDHDIDVGITSGGINTERDLENDWTDVVLGIAVDVPIANNWNWKNSVDAGFGGSEGTYVFRSNLMWKFHKHWATTLYYKYSAIEFENGSRGDADWYLYDIDESALGLTIHFLW